MSLSVFHEKEGYRLLAKEHNEPGHKHLRST